MRTAYLLTIVAVVALLLASAGVVSGGCQSQDALDRWQAEVAQQHLTPTPVRLGYAEEPNWYTKPEAFAGPTRLVAVGGSPALTSLEEAIVPAQDQALASAQRQMLRLLAEAQNRLVHTEIRAAEVVVLETPGRSGVALALAEWPERHYDGDPVKIPRKLPRYPPSLFAAVDRDPRRRFRVAAWAVSERSENRLYAYCRLELTAEKAKADLQAALRAKWRRHADEDDVPEEVGREIADAVQAVWEQHTRSR